MLQPWKEPKCLIDGAGGKLTINEETLEALSQVTGHMVIVDIVGLYRTGKSFLLNLLADQTKGTG